MINHDLAQTLVGHRRAAKRAVADMESYADGVLRAQFVPGSPTGANGITHLHQPSFRLSDPDTPVASANGSGSRRAPRMLRPRGRPPA